MRGSNRLIALVAALVALAAAVGIIAVALTRGSSAPSPAGSSNGATAAGQVIYDTGRDPNGRVIPRSGRVMSGAGCATCHGLSGHGHSTMMFSAPNITYANLTDPKGMLAPDGSRGPTYTDASLRRAVTAGIGADGGQLSTFMPRWQLTSGEFSDLLAYLKTLH
jgi:hypothetical protein